MVWNRNMARCCLLYRQTFCLATPVALIMEPSACVYCDQMDVGIMLASTNPVPPRLRGKLSGLILMAESVGRTVGPAGWAIMFAWSVSASGKNSPVGGFRFVFTVSAILMGVVAVMGWKALTEESMTHVVEDSPSPPSSSSSSFPGKKGHSPDGGFELMEAVVIEGRRRDYT